MAFSSNCDYYQFMEIGQEYYIYNQGYPNNYGPGTNCRWVAQSPQYTKILIMCPDIYLPASDNCREDYLAFALDGDSTLTASHRYCGSGALNLVSRTNGIAVGLSSPWFSRGGRFTCSLTAVVDDFVFPDPPPNGMQMRPMPKCDCGKRKPRRIVGGVQTGINEFPYMAGIKPLVFGDNFFCGATIISRRYALTAAHCVHDRNASELGLLVGEHDITTGSETDAAFLYGIKKFILHPYTDNEKVNDIALVKTKEKIVFNQAVRPICLPFKYTNKDFSGKGVTLLGWGLTEFTGPKSDYLQAVNVTVVSNEQCQQQYPNDQIFPTNLCTYGDGKDACQFDSGGPVIYYSKRHRRDFLVGIISFGKECASNIPGVNTRVSSYLAWIMEEIKDTALCVK